MTKEPKLILLEAFHNFLKDYNFNNLENLNSLLNGQEFYKWTISNISIIKEYVNNLSDIKTYDMEYLRRLIVKNKFDKINQIMSSYILKAAYSAVHYKNMIANIKNRPYLMYSAVLDQNTRPSHRALNKKVFYADDKIWDEIFPISDWNCRCSIIPLDDDDLKEMKIKKINVKERKELFNIERWWAYKIVRNLID
jgi:SPP1 gp7 family putative phage head morphogenesis protein